MPAAAMPDKVNAGYILSHSERGYNCLTTASAFTEVLLAQAIPAITALGWIFLRNEQIPAGCAFRGVDLSKIKPLSCLVLFRYDILIV